jgi:hypothetical protein
MPNYNFPPRNIPRAEDEMVLQTASEAQNEFDPTKQRKSSGAYSGARPEGLTNEEESYGAGMEVTKQLEKNAQSAETKYITQMADFMNNEKLSASKKIAELNRFIAWTIRKADSTLIRADERARKPYEHLRAIAEKNLESLTAERAI